MMHSCTSFCTLEKWLIYGTVTSNEHQKWVNKWRLKSSDDYDGEGTNDAPLNALMMQVANLQPVFSNKIKTLTLNFAVSLTATICRFLRPEKSAGGFSIECVDLTNCILQ